MKYALFAIILVLGACNNSNINSNDDKIDTIKNYDTGTLGAGETIAACYESINNKDTVFLSIFSEAKVITGSLIYNYYEKDKNSGTLKGNMFGDTLIADYIFKSEGKTSTREVAFLKKDSEFVEGYSDIKDDGGTMRFKDRSKLQFTGRPLLKVDCKPQ